MPFFDKDDFFNIDNYDDHQLPDSGENPRDSGGAPCDSGEAPYVSGAGSYDSKAVSYDSGTASYSSLGLYEDDELEKIYDTALTGMKKAYSEAAFLAAAERFRSIPGFRDADTLAAECLEKAEVCRKDAIYASAKTHQRKNTLSGYRSSIDLFGQIPGWKDADKQRAASVKFLKRKKTLRLIGIIAGSCAVLALTALILYAAVIVPRQRYQDAVTLYETGQYKEALRAFQDLDGYGDSWKMIRLCETAIKDSRYGNALALMKEGSYKRAIPVFIALDGHKDSEEKLLECRYLYASELCDAGRYRDAIIEYTNAAGFRDSKEKAAEAYEKHKETDLKTAGVGDSVFFGLYEQDNDTSDGEEYIEWRVLEKTGDRMLIISVYALDCLQYNEEDTAVTWETCSLRRWMNGSFFKSAFSPDEQRMIRPAAVTADSNPRYSTPAGKDTEDRVFLLSISEVEAYPSLDYARQCEVTEYCIARGAYSKSTSKLSSDDVAWWWLRSPGKYPDYAVYTLTDGSVYSDGRGVTSERGTVRPALWIDLSSD
ncbi:MAG: hypothetical protein IIY77_09870 [Lachnospiraceae bacterium]|nr:hypothetical protein [Lachnospiraceae bacterium]